MQVLIFVSGPANIDTKNPEWWKASFRSFTSCGQINSVSVQVCVYHLCSYNCDGHTVFTDKLLLVSLVAFTAILYLPQWYYTSSHYARLHICLCYHIVLLMLHDQYCTKTSLYSSDLLNLSIPGTKTALNRLKFSLQSVQTFRFLHFHGVISSIGSFPFNYRLQILKVLLWS